MAGGREWKTTEVAVLRWGYARGLPARAIGALINRSERAVFVKARKLGIKHKHGSVSEAVRLFEQAQGKPLIEVAKIYYDRRLSRSELAADIGIADISRDLKRLLPPELWQSWPHYTVGRQMAVEQRKA
ncbi:hypothetical protein [Halomonas sp. MS1]|nr:hypothetical protein [Halomonas sp. MS1]UTD55912.1 hypothetical protein NF683_01450 [Halomonas sp. MS1]